MAAEFGTTVPPTIILILVSRKILKFVCALFGQIPTLTENFINCDILV